MGNNWELDDILQEYGTSNVDRDYSLDDIISEYREVDDKKDEIFEEVSHIFEPVNDITEDEFEKLFYVFSSKNEDERKESKDIEISKKNKEEEKIFDNINDRVIDYVSKLLISTGYHFSGFSNMRELSQEILKRYYSIDKYQDIINGKYDEDIKYFGSFYSYEFNNSKEEAMRLLNNNFYYYDDRYKQMFTPDVVVEVITASALSFMDAKKKKEDINKKKVLDNIVFKRLFPNKLGTYGIDSGLIQLNDKISGLIERKKKTYKEDLKNTRDVVGAFAVGAMFGDLLPLALYGGYRLYKSYMDSKEERDEYEDKGIGRRR